jgi:C4-dicarboxylate transporter DctM subunit
MCSPPSVVPPAIAEVIINWGLPVWGFLIVVNILLLIAGNFMEPSAILLIMAPILFPIATQLGIDPIHLGIIMVVNMEIGMLTPPVGLNLFVTAGITGKNMIWVIRSCLPWLLLMLGFLMLITYIPQISLALPEYIDYLNGY